ncbi:MAG: 23S rRNA (adenine(2503)-C(2))-methyltransferase RlmN [Paludibacteraceae bacterium]|nr:23S rRNA (adenine(2503)-C(2))-methyltransferase RlmN [Paludibacteraceae bacterium]
MEKLLGKTLNELQQVALEAGLPRFAAKQLADWIYKKRVTDIDQMTNISLSGRKALKEKYEIGLYSPSAEAISNDGTKKYLFQVAPEKFIESVYIPENDRATLCVSTQIGCKMGCKFCMTGSLGFHGQLTATDILNQIYSIPDSLNLTNIVFMGEGEPCDNIEQVLRSLEILTAQWGCAWSPRRITVSSVGYLKGLVRLVQENECNIAISLHNPFSNERQEIMPIEKVYPIKDIISFLKQTDWSHQRRLSFEYICFGGINDSQRHVSGISNLLKGIPARVNLIRFHEGVDCENQKMNASIETNMIKMRDDLTQKGITTTIRKSRGEDILAACGMLVNALKDNK